MHIILACSHEEEALHIDILHQKSSSALLRFGTVAVTSLFVRWPEIRADRQGNSATPSFSCTRALKIISHGFLHSLGFSESVVFDIPLRGISFQQLNRLPAAEERCQPPVVLAAPDFAGEFVGKPNQALRAHKPRYLTAWRKRGTSRSGRDPSGIQEVYYSVAKTPPVGKICWICPL